jgi:hypothetical protein
LVQETVSANITGEYGDLSLRTSPGRKLERARVKLMSKQMLLLQSMRAQAGFTVWQFPLDAPFPRKKYEKIIDTVENIVNAASLIGFCSTELNLNTDAAQADSLEWQQSFQALQESVQQTSDEVTSLLCLLSSSILHAQPVSSARLRTTALSNISFRTPSGMKFFVDAISAVTSASTCSSSLRIAQQASKDQ